jgi:hypothetical protein
LTASGIPYRQGRYFDPPATTYAIYFDDVEVDGADGLEALILRHSATVELYAPTQDEAAEGEAAIEAQLLAAKCAWAKQARYWLQNVQRYQVVYEFDYNEKRRA